MTKVVVVDLDGTLCNSGHRDHLAQAREYDAFNARLVDDLPHDDVKWLLDVISRLPAEEVQIIALTGRSEKFRKLTLEWFMKHGIAIDDLIMRPEHDYTSDHELKPRMLEEHVARKDVLFILEDRERVVEAWRNLGYNCWQCRVGGY
jgi:FMN phosphatase YigB (HAD superfamily)